MEKKFSFLLFLFVKRYFYFDRKNYIIYMIILVFNEKLLSLIIKECLVFITIQSEQCDF